jgi:hypothetical protein
MNGYSLPLGLLVLLFALVALTAWGAWVDSQGDDLSGSRNDVAVAIGEWGSA